MADDQTRVILSLLQEEGQGDYINGNFIRVRLRVREWADGWGVSGILVVNLAFTRAQMEARPTSPHRDPCLIPC